MSIRTPGRVDELQLEEGARRMSRWGKALPSVRREELIRIAFWPLATRRSETAEPQPIEAAYPARARAVAKRMLDVVLALALLVVLAIPLLLIALAVKLDSHGPVLYRVSRVGFGGRPLAMLKFRKMHDHARGIALTADIDPRLTRVGRILARTRLDELPQLWDVLRGRMSVVGPRPEAPEFVALHSDAYRRILSVRPGITGLSQLAFAEEHSILDQSDLVRDYVDRILPQKIGLDTLYAREYGLGLDLRVLIWTAAAVLLGKRVSVHRKTGALTLRRRPQPAAEPAVIAVAETLAASPITAKTLAASPSTAETLVASPITPDCPAAEPARAA
jgi:lipopolysaccharide/colanic/teichoic acid biosynthesis glycosyltransferase